VKSRAFYDPVLAAEKARRQPGNHERSRYTQRRNFIFLSYATALSIPIFSLIHRILNPTPNIIIPTMPQVQTLDARYIDGAALLALLNRLFGRGNFRISVSFLSLL
jgi:hypothetical protein